MMKSDDKNRATARDRTLRPAAQQILIGFAICVGALSFSGCLERESTIVVGSKNFTEQVILGELLAQHIENQLGLKVVRRLNLAGTFICHEAVRSGEIDLYAEYTGTAFTGILEFEPVASPDFVYDVVSREYEERFGLEWTEQFGFNNSFAIMVRGEDARSLGLKDLSQVAEYTPGWRAGFGYEFLERADGLSGLVAAYDLKFAESPLEMDLGLMYRALQTGQVDLIAGNSTEGLVEALDLVVLNDDRNYFPPYYAAPVVNKKSLRRHQDLREVLNLLGNRISDSEMRRMNYAVDGEGQSVREVVEKFLREEGL